MSYRKQTNGTGVEFLAFAALQIFFPEKVLSVAAPRYRGVGGSPVAKPSPHFSLAICLFVATLSSHFNNPSMLFSDP